MSLLVGAKGGTSALDERPACYADLARKPRICFRIDKSPLRTCLRARCRPCALSFNRFEIQGRLSRTLNNLFSSNEVLKSCRAYGFPFARANLYCAQTRFQVVVCREAASVGRDLMQGITITKMCQGLLGRLSSSFDLHLDRTVAS